MDQALSNDRTHIIPSGPEAPAVNNCGGGSSPLGNPRPDDNYSAASPTLPLGQLVALPEGARSTPRVALLRGSVDANQWWRLLQMGEPAPSPR